VLSLPLSAAADPVPAAAPATVAAAVPVTPDGAQRTAPSTWPRPTSLRCSCLRARCAV